MLAYDFEVDGIYYDSLSSRTCEVVRGDGYKKDNILIPKTVSFNGKDFEVIRIGSDAFYAQKAVKSIHIPTSVTAIGSEAFMHCKGLLSINVEAGNPVYSSHQGALYDKSGTCLIKVPIGKTEFSIPSSVTDICDDAFHLCRLLKIVRIPSSVTRIGGNAFAGCDSLREVEISGSVEYIGEYAFCGCKALTVLAIPNSVNSIGRNILSYCTSLKTVTLPSGIDLIPQGMFNGCTELKTVKIPDGITIIDDYAFAQCDSLQTISIPCTVTILGDNVFQNCSSLRSFEMPEGVTTVGNQVFEYCSKLETITLPSTLAHIGEKVFNGCKRLEKIEVSEDNIAYKSIKGVLFDHSLNSLIKCPSLITSDSIPPSVTQIRPYAYFKCNALSKVRIPESVKEIGEWSFVGCSSLDSVFMTRPVDLTETYLPDLTRTLYVPAGKKSDFENSCYYFKQYSLFKAIVEYGDATTSIIDNNILKNDAGGANFYTLQGVKMIDKAPKKMGIYIVDGKKVIVK